MGFHASSARGDQMVWVRFTLILFVPTTFRFTSAVGWLENHDGGGWYVFSLAVGEGEKNGSKNFQHCF